MNPNLVKIETHGGRGSLELTPNVVTVYVGNVNVGKVERYGPIGWIAVYNGRVLGPVDWVIDGIERVQQRAGL